MRNKEKEKGLWKTLASALSLNANFYENAPINALTNRVAQTIVILAAISHALGSWVVFIVNWTAISILPLALLIDALSIVAGYYFWTLTIWRIGRWLRRNSPSYRELLIPIGFAYAPQVLNFLTLIPLLGEPIELILSVWSLLAVIVAVRQGLDINTIWATVISLLGWPLIQIAINFIQESWSRF
ncbi:MAG: hypothetical protein KME01_04105 [Chroococcus sp. CMT-3BRIN-NPC107]|nr:hypothetical protein [Chroococcus sp. CMT-3BRIN-NPC107]